MIQLWCMKCGKELDKPGALIFSPPPPGSEGDRQQLTVKYHLCDQCFEPVHRLISNHLLDQQPEHQT